MKKKILSFFMILFVALSLLPVMLPVGATVAPVFSPLPSDFPTSMPSYTNMSRYALYKFADNYGYSAAAGKYGVDLYDDRTVADYQLANDNKVTLRHTGYRQYYWDGSSWVNFGYIDWADTSNADYQFPWTKGNGTGKLYKLTLDIPNIYQPPVPVPFDYKAIASGSEISGAPAWSTVEALIGEWHYPCAVLAYDTTVSKYVAVLSGSYIYDDKSGADGSFVLNGPWRKFEWDSSRWLAVASDSGLNVSFWDFSGRYHWIKSNYNLDDDDPGPNISFSGVTSGTHYSGFPEFTILTSGYSGFTAKLYCGSVSGPVVTWTAGEYLGSSDNYIAFIPTAYLPRSVCWLDTSKTPSVVRYEVNGIQKYLGPQKLEVYASTGDLIYTLNFYVDGIPSGNSGTIPGTGGDGGGDGTTSIPYNLGDVDTTGFDLLNPSTWFNPLNQVFQSIAGSFNAVGNVIGSCIDWLPIQITALIAFGIALSILFRILGR